jgi:hypothetical protein
MVLSWGSGSRTYQRNYSIDNLPIISRSCKRTAIKIKVEKALSEKTAALSMQPEPRIGRSSLAQNQNFHFFDGHGYAQSTITFR